ncbi:MAG: phasin family protein [Alphaproteobacteria bacterium]|nr:phasin family protein [Alphaproteobacteria bacterium]
MSKNTNIPPFGEEIFNAFKQFKVPGVDMEALAASHQKNMELLASTQRKAVESTNSIVELQNKYLKNAFDQWNEQLKHNCTKTSFEEKTACHAQATKEMSDKALEHMKEINTIIVKSNEKILDSIQKHFQESFNDSLNLVKKNKNNL